MIYILVFLILALVLFCIFILYREYAKLNADKQQSIRVEIPYSATEQISTEDEVSSHYPTDQAGAVEPESAYENHAPETIVPEPEPLWQPEPAAASKLEALFATLSHELRTPLNGILGMSQIMSAESPGDERLGAIEAASRHMLTILSNLVNLRKLESEDFEETREWCDPQEILDEVKNRLRYRAQTRGMKLVVTSESKMKRIRWDREHLLSTLENLVLASMEETPLQQQQATAQFSLSWSIANDEKTLAFTLNNPREAWRNDRVQTQFEAFGLTVGTSHPRVSIDGLLRAVAMGLVSRRQGEINYQQVSGEEGNGVHCQVRLPLEQVMSGSSLTRSPFGGGLSLQTRSLATTTTHLNILLAEDDPTNQKVIAYMLGKMGHTLTITNNGQEALDTFQATPDAFDLILMDIDMPVMDGMHATVNFRSGDVGPKGLTVPIAAVTAFASTSDQGRFFKIGMNYFLAKPISSEKLRTLFLEVERKSRGR